MVIYYGTFWGYYWHPELNARVLYNVADKVYFIETNLCNEETEELWSTQSETYNPQSLESLATFSEEFARDICVSLDKENVI